MTLRDREIMVLVTIIVIALGLGLVAYLVTFGPMGLKGFTELYFENPDLLPKAVRVGEKVTITFTIVSHEREPLKYYYALLFRGKLIRNGTLALIPSEKATFSFTFIPNSTTLTLYDNYTTKCEVELPYSFLELRPSKLGGEEYVYLTPLEGELSLFYHNHTLKAVMVPSPFNPSSYFLLPLRNESCIKYTYVTTRRVGNFTFLKNVECNLSNLGYDKIVVNYEIIKKGDKQVIIKCTRHIMKYRYKFEKVSVELTSRKGKYEIHFWLIVTK